MGEDAVCIARTRETERRRYATRTYVGVDSRGRYAHPPAVCVGGPEVGEDRGGAQGPLVGQRTQPVPSNRKGASTARRGQVKEPLPARTCSRAATLPMHGAPPPASLQASQPSLPRTAGCAGRRVLSRAYGKGPQPTVYT